jgi:hypothetical protein
MSTEVGALPCEQTAWSISSNSGNTVAVMLLINS